MTPMVPARIKRSRASGERLPIGTKTCTRPGPLCNPFVSPDVDYCLKVFRHYAKAALWEGMNDFGWRIDSHHPRVITSDDLPVQIVFGLSLNGVWHPSTVLTKPVTLRAMPDAIQFHMNFVRALDAKYLACWCALSEPCHVDVIRSLMHEWHRRNPTHTSSRRSRATLARTT